MTPAELDDFLARVKIGLENEDRVLLGAHLARGEHGGLIRLQNERYYQFIVWRAAIPIWRAQVEYKTHDLALFDNEGRCAAVFEMKRWMSERGTKEVPKIRSDIAKLARHDAPTRGIMVFAANPRGNHVQLAAALSSEIPELSQACRRVAAFDTLNDQGAAYEFWLGIWVL